MRVVYVDEAGISADEPIAVVAGLVVHADRQWKSLEEYRNQLIRRFIPPEDHTDFVFHASELFSGGRYFQRERWPLRVRLEILESLVSAIPTYELSLIVGLMPRQDRYVSALGKREARFRHTAAYCLCIAGIESYMRSFAELDEVALVVAENTNDTRRMIKQTHHDLLAQHEGLKSIGAFQEAMPMRHIVETVHFAEKVHSTLLQFADACAFVIRRYVAGLEHVDNLMRVLTSGAYSTDNMRLATAAGYEVFVQGASAEQVKRHQETLAALGRPTGQWREYVRQARGDQCR